MSGELLITGEPAMWLTGPDRPGGPVHLHISLEKICFTEEQAEPCTLDVNIFAPGGLAFDGRAQCRLKLEIRPGVGRSEAMIDAVPGPSAGEEIRIYADFYHRGRHSGYCEESLRVPDFGTVDLTL